LMLRATPREEMKFRQKYPSLFVLPTIYSTLTGSDINQYGADHEKGNIQF